MTDLDFPTSVTISCGRTTLAGKACRRNRLDAWPGPPAPACRDHLTDPERARVEGYKAGYEAGMNVYRPAPRDPVCWSWPPLPEGVDWWDWHPPMCAACGSKGDLVTDHDHVTGLIRGRLCRSCNAREGSASYTPVRIERYREKNPATMRGFRETYWDPWHGEAKPQPILTPEEELARSAEVARAVSMRLFGR